MIPMNSQKKAIAIFGGAFDPIHLGHISMIKNLDKIQFINEIWLLPSGRRNDRNSKPYLLVEEERVQVLTKVVQKQLTECKVIRVVDEQIRLSRNQNRMIPTIQMLEYFTKKYEGCQFYFVIGADNMKTIQTWRQYQKLLKIVGYQINGIVLPEKYYLVDFIPLEISASVVRNAIENKNISREDKINQIKHVVDQVTLSYIDSKHLL